MTLESTFNYPLTYYTTSWDEPGLFTPSECDEIIRIGHMYPLQEATVYVDGPGHKEDSVRRSRIGPICSTPEQSWIYERISSIVHRANSGMSWNFSLSGIELIQFSQYKAEYLGAFKDHLDILDTKQNHVRKISVCVQLSPPDQYEGGELCLFNLDPVPKTRGFAAVFTSFLPHSVKPVLRGTRYSLVAWASGPKFI